MNQPKLLPCGIIFALISLSLILCSVTLYADQQAITDDGREVLLRSDGTWSLRSTERVKITYPGITLRNTVIEKHEIRAHKNKRIRTRTVFYLGLKLSPLATDGITFSNDDASRIEVTDNNGKSYPVLAVQHDTTTLQPGSSTTIAVQVEGSPTWFDNAKSMQITFRPGIFGITEATGFSRNLDEFEEIDVDGFDTID